MARRRSTSRTTAAPTLEARLWAAADALRNNMDVAEYKHVVLGLIFLKYISDAFEAKHAELAADQASGADPEDPDEYRAANVFWVPKEARWSHLRAGAPQPTIGTIVDDASSSRGRRGRRGGSSTRRRAWCASWSRCSPRTAGACTTRAAARAGCS